MRVGIAETNITPDPGLPRAGMPNPQPGQGTAWPLMARVFVVKRQEFLYDGKRTYL